MEKPVPNPLVLDAQEQDGDLCLAVGEKTSDQFHGRPAKATVGALDDIERDTRQPELGPYLTELIGAGAVHREVHCSQIVRREGSGVLDGTGCCQVELIDQHEHDMSTKDWGRASPGRVLSQLVGLLDILTVEAKEQDHQDRDRRDDDPTTLGEFGHCDDAVDDQ